MKLIINQSIIDNKIQTNKGNNQVNTISKTKSFLKYNSSTITDLSLLLHKSPLKNQKPQPTPKISRLYNYTKKKR